MLLLFEGCDGSGKTTLADTLSEYWGFKVINFKYPETGESHREQMIEQLKEYETTLKVIKALGDEVTDGAGKYHINVANIIFDRFHLGEMVYPQVTRGYKIRGTVFEHKFRKIDNALVKLGAKLIYFYAPIDIIMDRIGGQEKEYVTKRKDIGKLLTEYLKALLWTKLPLIKINTAVMNKLQMFDYARRKLKLFRRMNAYGDNIYNIREKLKEESNNIGDT